MPGRRRSNGQLVRDRRRIADLYLKGWLQVDIADDVGLHQSMVSRDLKAIQKQWINSTLVDFNEVRAREVAKIDQLEREHWMAWERSCLDAETTTEKGKAKQGQTKPESVEKTIQRKGQVGDPRFLAGIQWCIDRRIKLFGLDEPDRLVVDWKQEAREAGLDPGDIFERYVQAAAAVLGTGGETAGSTGMDGSEAAG